jgi:uncharacterized protein
MIGFLTCECRIYDAYSLKDKRSVLKKLINRIRKHYNVSVSETNHQDIWNLFELGFVMISTDKVVIERELQKILKTIDTFTELECTDYAIEWL